MENRTVVVLDGDSATLPFRYEHGLILLEAEGPTGEALVVELDTCTALNAVREDLARSHAWPTGRVFISQGIVADCKEPSRETEIPSVRIGGVEIKHLLAHTDPLGGPAAPDVMLGAGILGELVVQVDFARRRVTLVQPRTWTAPAPSPHVAVLALDAEIGGVPCLRGQVRIDGVPVATTLVDTGFNGSVLLSGAVAEAVGLSPGGPGIEEIGAGGYGGPARLRRGRVRALEIGPFRAEDLTALRPPDAPSPFRDDAWAILGNRFLQGFRVTWALPCSQLVLERTPSA